MTEWYGNGNKRTQKKFIGDQTKRTFPEFGPNIMKSGEKNNELNYKDGELNGLAVNWYKNGQKESESTFNAGQRLSVIVWNPSGEKCSETNFKMGVVLLLHTMTMDQFSVARTSIKRKPRRNLL